MSIQTNKLPDNPQIEVIKSGKTGLFTNYIYKAIPLAFDESMSYYETLCGLLHYLKNVILPTVNNNADAVAELQTLYEELRTYVDDYFKGLDVQEEINNKLDEMVEDGTLQEIIASYLDSKAIFGFDNVASMKQATNLINGSYAKTLGFYNKNDGGNALYKIRQITNEDVVDEMTILSMQNQNLIAELIINYPINPLTLGAKGDGINDDYNYIQKAINLGNVKLTKGSYYITNTLSMLSTRIFDGNNRPIIPASNTTAFQLVGNGVDNAITNTVMKNINIFTTENVGSNGIYLKDGYFNYFENINIQRLNGNNTYGIKIVNGFHHIFRNGRVLGDLSFTGQIGFDISSTNNGDGIENMTNNLYENFLIQRVQYGVKTNFVTSCNVAEINNFGFSGCNYCYYLDGYAQPISIRNSRMEISNASWDTYGIYIKGVGIRAYIETLNAYDIKYPIYNETTNDLYINGTCTFNGTPHNPKLNAIISNGNIVNNAYTYYLSNTYNLISSASLPSGKFYANNNNFTNLGQEINNDNYSMSPDNRIYKATQRIFNLYGLRGQEALIYTELRDIHFQTSTNGSTTSMLTGQNIDLIPNQFYKIKFIDTNKWTLIN